MNDLIVTFDAAARSAGAEVYQFKDLGQAVDHIQARAQGSILLPRFPSGERAALGQALQDAGCRTISDNFRQNAAEAAAGITGVNFALAETGTLVLESTAEEVRLASTLPERHFALLDPRKIVADGTAAVPLLRRFHEAQPRNFLAYITGPSRTADIERVLTIGVHGPRELHVLLVEGISDDPLEM